MSSMRTVRRHLIVTQNFAFTVIVLCVLTLGYVFGGSVNKQDTDPTDSYLGKPALRLLLFLLMMLGVAFVLSGVQSHLGGDRV